MYVDRYLAPEACNGRGLLPATDVWAAGVMVRKDAFAWLL